MNLKEDNKRKLDKKVVGQRKIQKKYIKKIKKIKKIEKMKKKRKNSVLLLKVKLQNEARVKNIACGSCLLLDSNSKNKKQPKTENEKKANLEFET